MNEKKEDKLTVSKRLSAGYSVDAILVRSPLKYLQDMIAQDRLLEGVIVSVIYFERFGIERLKEYFKSRSIPIEPLKIEGLRLPVIMRMLEGFGIITQRIHSLMGEVYKERNEIVHKLKHPDAIDKTKTKKTIEKAIECLKALGLS